MNIDLWLHNVTAFSLQVAALTAVGTIVPSVLRLRHPIFLLRYWQVLFAVCLLLPFIQPWRSFPTKSFSPNPFVAVQIHTTAEVAATGESVSSLPRILVVVLVLGFSGRLMSLVVGLFRLRSYVQRAQRLSPIPEGIADMCRIVAVNPAIYSSADIRSAVALGLWPPMILVPESFAKMGLDLQRAIICHELWHIRRNDWLFSLFEELILAILWFHPAIWWLTSRIRLSREQVVDQLVLKTTSRRKAYLDALVQTALAQNRPGFRFAPPFLTQHHLTQRVALILTEVAMSRSHIAIAVVVSVSLLWLTGVMSARAFPLESSSSPSPVPIVAGAQAISTEELGKRLISKVNPIYPADAKKQGVQGEVVLAVGVNERGEVTNIQVLKGPAPLVLSALDAVKQWRYAPYLKDEVAVAVHSTVTVTFSLSDSAKTENSTSEPITVRLNENVMARQLVAHVKPSYPSEAKERGVQGEVEFDVTIDERGEVIDVLVLGGNGMLVAAAYEAVRQSRYEPVVLNGTPVRAQAPVTVKFQLNP